MGAPVKRGWCRVAICMSLALFCAAVSFRIVWVNTHVPAYPRESHAVGERVALEGSFAEFRYENTEGYSIEVTDARIMSCDEYLDRFAPEGTTFDFGAGDETDAAAPVLAVLDMTVRNDKKAGDKRGYLDSIGWSMVPTGAKHMDLRVDSELLNASLPQLGGAYQLSIKPGTEYELHVPFSTSFGAPFPAKAGSWYRPPLTDVSYELTVTNVPVRHVFGVDATR